MTCSCGCSGNLPCGCCEGVEILTPQPTANRPGLSALYYRVGTHATFLETMEARLSSRDFPSLRALKTRAENDPSIALLDGAATMLDVLTFYQERIVNEGYLRTAYERRSILELARLVGYRLRPGVAASVYLAYTLDDKSDPVEIPEGARAQSVPAPNELPQSFETSEKLLARKEWNNLQPRLTRRQEITLASALTIETVYFNGIDTKLNPNDPLLFVFGDAQGRQVMRRIRSVTPQFDNQRTQVALQTVPALAVSVARLMDKLINTLVDAHVAQESFAGRVLKEAETLRQNIYLGSYPVDARVVQDSLGDHLHELINSSESGLDTQTIEKLKGISEQLKQLSNRQPTPPPPKPPQTNLTSLFSSLLVSQSLQPASSLQLRRDKAQTFNRKSDLRAQLLVNFHPRLAETLHTALSQATVSVIEPELQGVFALRVAAPLFGYNAPPVIFDLSVPPAPKKPELDDDELENRLFLDNAYDQILASDEKRPSYIVINRPDNETVQTFKIKEAKIHPRTAYGLSGKTTEIVLNDDDKWRDVPTANANNEQQTAFDVIRKAVVYAQSEELTLAEEPINDDVRGETIELDALYEGLQSGQWIIVSGERTDIAGVSGVQVSELAMLAGVLQKRNSPGDKLHTTLTLAGRNKDGKPGLQYTYKRDTVKIYGNVVKATHGETRNEVLGSGDGSLALQAFTLKQPPLTYVSAPTPDGIESTLHVRVNDVEWHEADSLVELKPRDRKFITKTDDDAKTTVIFGNGKQGARLPTSIENVKAVYRNGIGKVGNVKAEQISLLLTKPLGVREVINPLRASGGADKESRDQARRNVPLAVMALDRLVSTEDYADFARTFAGIGKASAERLSDGHRQLVHLTIAGTDDIPIDVTSDLYHNLRRALASFGDPFQPIQVVTRELLALVIIAGVRVLPDYLWEVVAAKIRAALLDAFSFERRELGQSVFLSEVISVAQRVEGVAFVDVDVFDSISETELSTEKLLKAKLKQLQDAKKPNPYVRAQLAHVNPNGKPPKPPILPAQMAYLTPDVPDTLILNSIEEVKR